MVIRSILELALIVFTVYCVAQEEKIATWERRTARRFLRWLMKEGEAE